MFTQADETQRKILPVRFVASTPAIGLSRFAALAYADAPAQAENFSGREQFSIGGTDDGSHPAPMATIRQVCHVFT